MAEQQAQERPKELTGWTKILVDFGPLLVFFFANYYFERKDAWNPIGGKPIIAASAAFTAAFLIGMAYSWIKTRHVSPMTAFTGLIVIIFGGLTVFLKNDLFIKLRPTIVNSLLGLLLLGGYLMGRSPLKTLMSDALPTMTETGWAQLTKVWIGFFFFSAALNEILRRVLSDKAYVAYTSWGDILVTFAFVFLTAPIIMKHEHKPSEGNSA